MTTIIGIQGQDYALVCSDSRISSMDDGGFASQITTLSPNSSKVSENGKYILGAAGDMRAINILQHVFVPPVLTPVTLSGKKLDNFITTKFIPSLRECFEKQGYAAPQRESSYHMAEQGSTIIAVANSTIYIIEGDYSWVSDANGFYALGTGAAYALGSMYAISKSKKLTLAQAKKAALESMHIAARFDPYTGSPFHIYVQQKS